MLANGLVIAILTSFIYFHLVTLICCHTPTLKAFQTGNKTAPFQRFQNLLWHLQNISYVSRYQSKVSWTVKGMKKRGHQLQGSKTEVPVACAHGSVQRSISVDKIIPKFVRLVGAHFCYEICKSCGKCSASKQLPYFQHCTWP